MVKKMAKQHKAKMSKIESGWAGGAPDDQRRAKSLVHRGASSSSCADEPSTAPLLTST